MHLIEKWGWALDPYRVTEYDYKKIVNNVICRLHFDKRNRTWIFTKDGKIMFKGEIEKNMDEISEVLSDINLICYS